MEYAPGTECLTSLFTLLVLASGCQSMIFDFYADEKVGNLIL